jgi:hypothetical protein
MFRPPQWFLFDKPARNDHWFVSIGHTSDGAKIDVFGSLWVSEQTGIATVCKPALDGNNAPAWSTAYRSHRWRKMLSRLAEEKYTALRSE